MVAEGEVPAQPVLELRGNRGIELEPVIAGVRQVGINAEALCDRRSLVQLGIKLFADDRFRAVLDRRCDCGEWRRWSEIRQGISSEGIAVVSEAAVHVQRGACRLDGVITKAAAKNRAEIKVLQGVGFKIGSRKREERWLEVVVAARPGGQGICRGAVGRSGTVLSVDVCGVKGDLIAGRFADCLRRQSEALG